MSRIETDPPDTSELDDELDEWLERDDEPEAPRESGVMMRHPALLVLVLLSSAFVSFRASQDLRKRMVQRDVVECGDLGERPHLRAAAAGKLAPLPDDRWCHLTGIVSSQVTLATGEPAETTNPYKKHADRKFYVRLAGDRVWAVVPGDSWDANNHRIKKGSLFGFQVDAVGHILDPDRMSSLRPTADRLRLKWGEPRDAEMRIFDLTHDVPPIWPPLAVLLVAVLATLLAVYGLLRMARRRREDAAA